MPTVSGFSRDSRQGPAGRRFEVFTNRSPRPIYLGRMIKSPIPPDLTWCIRCRKLIGPHGGWFGPECQCGRPRRKPPEGPVGPWGPPPV